MAPNRSTRRSLGRTLRTCAALLLVAPAALASCQSVASPEEEVLVYEVAPTRVTCQGEAVQQCLQVREPGQAEWRNFYGTIEGFTHVSGHRYVIEVARRRIADPPADGSSFAYRLLRILESEEVIG
jgi:hypothetical protein